MKGNQETNTSSTREGGVYFRGNLEVGRSEDVPEAETHGGPTRTLGGDEDF